MNTYQRLLCFMKVLVQNMGILHRNLIDDEAWFANHKQIDKWQSELTEQTDDLIETGIALGFKEPTISEAVMQFSTDVLSADKRELKETFGICLRSFRDLAGYMQASEAEVPASVQNKLQEYEYYWNKEANYKLAAALGERAEAGRMNKDE